MLYSSCKGPLTELMESLGLQLVKKVRNYIQSNIFISYCMFYFQLEIDDGSELTEEFLQDELHPKKNLHRPKFAKPKGPPNRGAKRLTKTQPSDA